ncbi:MAG: undecaprenyl-diphosphate phosphatase [Burkholderiales bacterium]
MDFLLLLKALILGLVEGATEFLPVSSTGHLIIVGDLLNFNDDKGKVFEIVIQLGAILAVCWEYRAKIATTISGMLSDSTAQRFIVNLIIAFLPAAILGFLFIKTIKAHLFNPVSVAIALIVGAFVIFWVERMERRPRIREVDDMTARDALMVGIAQAVSLIPGTSRAGATIIGGMLAGLSRKTATEFSFFLAIPTMFAATFYDVFKHRDLLHATDLPMFAVGFVVSFVAALIAVRALIRFVSSHNFKGFAWYRLIFGTIVLLYFWGRMA